MGTGRRYDKAADIPMTSGRYFSIWLRECSKERFGPKYHTLRSRLNATDFELLEEKEKLEEDISHGNRLSAPFIRLTSDTALVPLKGALLIEDTFLNY